MFPSSSMRNSGSRRRDWEKPRHDRGSVRSSAGEPGSDTPILQSSAQMNNEAQQQVMRVAEPKKLLGWNADLLEAAYGAALSVVNGHSSFCLEVRRRGAGVWQHLGQQAGNTLPAFIASLLSRDDGKALAFFNLLTSLPPLQQRFFTKSASTSEQASTKHFRTLKRTT